MVNAYPDTSFLFNLYAPQAHSAQAAEQFAAMKEALHLTSLNRFELVSAIHLALFRETILAQGAHRGFDILHVATALELSAQELLTFDAQQSRLAKAVGLKVKP